MKKRNLYAITSLIALCLISLVSSCGEKNSSSSITISRIDYTYDEMTDSLRKVVEIESDECVIEKNGFGYATTSLVLKCECSKYDKHKIAKVSNGTIALLLLDENEVEIGEMVLNNNNSKELFDWLKTADLLAKKEFSFIGDLSDDVLSKVKSIKYKYKEMESPSISKSITEENTSDSEDEIDAEMENEDKSELDANKNETSSQENGISIDELLSEYEQFANDYIAFLKKVDANDPSALVEMAEWTNKQTLILSKLDDVHGEMGAKQLSRMNGINIKIMNAASKLKK